MTTAALSVERAAQWVLRPDCGALVTFAGTVRDHAEGRRGVDELEYEAYDSQVEPRLRLIAEEAMARWTGVGRVVIWHRVGTLGLGETSVLVAVASAHRADAFDAARYCIDTVKTSVPIWKRERWDGGEDWGLDAHDVADVDREPADREPVDHEPADREPVDHEPADREPVDHEPAAVDTPGSEIAR